MHAICNGYSCPIIDTGGVTPGLNVISKSRYIVSSGRPGKAIRGFPGYLPASGSQLPEIDIVIRFIVQDCSLFDLRL